MKPPTPNLFSCPTSHSLIPSLIHPSPVAHRPIGGRRAGNGDRQAGDGRTSRRAGGRQPESGRASDGRRRLARGRAMAAGRDRSRATGIGPERRESVHSDGDRSMVRGIGRLFMGKHWGQLQGRREKRGSGRKIRRKLILD
jgi:hypothetical protein